MYHFPKEVTSNFDLTLLVRKKFSLIFPDFLNANDHDVKKVIGLLEERLAHFACLSTGDTIPIVHENKTYLLDVLETRPEKSISLVSDPYLDVKLEFAPPLDLKEDSVLKKPDLKQEEPPKEIKEEIPKGKTLANETVEDTNSVTCSNW
jgi:hypothetical protein